MKNDELKQKSFEDALKELEDIVNTLEVGDLELEKSLTLYEKGIELSNHLKNVIEEGKTRIITLSKQNDEITEMDFISED